MLVRGHPVRVPLAGGVLVVACLGAVAAVLALLYGMYGGHLGWPPEPHTTLLHAHFLFAHLCCTVVYTAMLCFTLSPPPLRAPYPPLLFTTTMLYYVYHAWLYYARNSVAHKL